MPNLRLGSFLILSVAVSAPAYALRPFDGTDAGVVDRGEFELEFSPFGRLRDNSGHTWLVPAVVGNWGLFDGGELVLEGKRKKAVSSLDAEGERAGLIDAAISIKQVHRRGVLQGANGASVASECGILLPGIHDDHGAGASCALIVSRRSQNVTSHVNAGLAYTRQHKWAPFVSMILEGPATSNVRPVTEVYAERESGGPPRVSGLVGMVWTRSEDLSLDLGLRRMRSDQRYVNEIRLGLTWTATWIH